MMYKSHVAFGGAILVGLASAGLTQIDIFTVGCAVVFSLLPDIDHPGSKLGRKLKPISLLLDKTVGHRTLTHSLLATAVVSALAYLFLPAYIALVISASYASHLVADIVTKQRIMLFWPSRQWVSLGWCKSGGMFDHLVFLPACITVALIPATPYIGLSGIQMLYIAVPGIITGILSYFASLKY